MSNKEDVEVVLAELGEARLSEVAFHLYGSECGEPGRHAASVTLAAMKRAGRVTRVDVGTNTRRGGGMWSLNTGP